MLLNNGGPMLLKTDSTHSFFKSKTQWHCGACSQCIDRRIAILAAGQEQNDLETDYVSDVFVGPRKDGQEKNMAVDYVRHAVELDSMGETEIASSFNLELSRAARFSSKRGQAVQHLVSMHKRHAAAVKQVLHTQLLRHADELIEGTLASTSMLAMIAGQQHLASSWARYADRIAGLLSAGLPIACKSHKPKDEPHLQEICDGILKAQDTDLVREFPFMRWSSSLTKPDWSVERLQLWVELKYVRTKADVRPITKAIAEDITKYGDNERRVLYVVYDPSHIVTEEKEFSAPIVARPGMLVRFIR
jgi:hypothetical protein